MKKCSAIIIAICLSACFVFIACDNDDKDSDEGNNEDIGDFEVTLKDNPICALSCIVTWSTPEAASSWVKFGKKGKSYSHRIGNDDPVTHHEVVVVGMHAASTYKLRAVSENESKELTKSEEITFTTGPLPYNWMAGEMDVNDESQTQNGWTLTNLASGSMATNLTMAMYDMSGEIVWYYHDDQFGRIDNVISLTNDNHILAGPGLSNGEKVFAMNLKGEVVWEGLEQSGYNSDSDLHHVFYQAADGNYVITRNMTDDEVLIFNSNLETVWSWKLWDHMEPVTQDPGQKWTHVNSVSLDPVNNNVFILSYTLRLIFKIDMETNEIVWTLGLDGDFAADPNADHPWFEAAHGMDYLGDNQYLLYDNGDVGRDFSRAIIYELDESKMESAIVWEYAGEDDMDHWFNITVGDADKLENGNILITAGNGAINQSPTRFIEVTPGGEKVWQMWLYNNTDTQVASYQADRIPSLAQPL